jgi:ABC-2 type transport system permease protein
MEYRAAFLTQVAGMMLNNAFYFAFWVLFFDRFREVKGWQLPDMMLLFGIVACGFGLTAYLFGNAFRLSEVVAGGRLDYFLALPRPVLPHALASRSIASGLGDLTYGTVSFLLAGSLSAEAVARFAVATFLSAVVLLSFLVLVQSLAFWLGNTTLFGRQMINAMVTFAIYPITLFDGSAKLVLFTLVPAAFVGAVPAELVRSFHWSGLVQLAAAAAVFLALAVTAFHRGLRRYESGSAFQVQA